MKEHNFYRPNLFAFSLLFVTFISSISCSKEEEEIQIPKSFNSSIQIVNVDMPDKARGFMSSGTMPSFSSYADFNDEIAALESAIDLHEEAFLAQHLNLTDEQLNAIEISTGFNVYQPLIDFENQYSFTNSLRPAFNLLEEQWLSNAELDLSTAPSNTILFDAIEQALLNDQQEVMIAGKIYVFGKPDFSYEISGDYGVSLAKINNGEDVTNDPNIVVSSKGGACKTWTSSSDFHDYSNDRKVLRTLTIRSVPFVCKTKSEVNAYKKRGSRWEKHRTNLGVTLQIHLKDQSCDKNKLSGYKSESVKNRRSRTVRMYNWGYGYALRAQNNASVNGTFKYGSLTTYKTLAC